MASHVQPGFDFDEMRTLLEIAQQTYTGIAPSTGARPVPAPPSNWQLDADLTPKGATLLDNYWQVRRNQDEDNQYCIAVRGTVATAPSVLEDLLLPLVRAPPCDLARALRHPAEPGFRPRGRRSRQSRGDVAYELFAIYLINGKIFAICLLTASFLYIASQICEAMIKNYYHTRLFLKDSSTKTLPR